MAKKKPTTPVKQSDDRATQYAMDVVSSRKITKESGVYQVVNIINNDKYIGSAVNLRQRWKLHKSCLRRNTHHSIHLQRAFNKYGEKYFVFEILILCDREKLLDVEQSFLDNNCPSYNICKKAGSTFGVTPSDETRKLLSDMRKGDKNPNFGGKSISEYQRRLMSERRKGKKLSEETKKKISIAGKGRKCSPETRKRMSIAFTGRKRPDMSINQLGKKRPDVAKALTKIHEHNGEFRSAKEWAAILGISYKAFIHRNSRHKGDHSKIFY